MRREVATVRIARRFLDTTRRKCRVYLREKINVLGSASEFFVIKYVCKWYFSGTGKRASGFTISFETQGFPIRTKSGKYARLESVRVLGTRDDDSWDWNTPPPHWLCVFRSNYLLCKCAVYFILLNVAKCFWRGKGTAEVESEGRG